MHVGYDVLVDQPYKYYLEEFFNLPILMYGNQTFWFLWLMQGVECTVEIYRRFVFVR